VRRKPLSSSGDHRSNLHVAEAGPTEGLAIPLSLAFTTYQKSGGEDCEARGGGAAAVGSVEVEGINIVTGGDGLVGVLRGERLWICIGVEMG